MHTLNPFLLMIWGSGKAVLNSTKLRGKYCLRAAITNHRSRREDFELLIREVVSLGRRLLEEGVVRARA